jgi:hypothetical protein
MAATAMPARLACLLESEDKKPPQSAARSGRRFSAMKTSRIAV